MGLKRIIRALAAALLAAVVLVPSPARAAVTYEAIFSYPTVTGRQDTIIEDKLIELTGKAKPGSTIYIGLYTITRTGVSDALLAADSRGVEVHFITESTDGEIPKAKADLKARLGGNFTDCDNNCIGPAGSYINHNKFWVFSALDDGRTDVVVQSSQNMTLTQTYMHNNAVIVSGDAGLATEYRNYFAKMKTQQPTTFSGSRKSSDGKVELFFSPRNKASDSSTYGNSDLVAGLLTKGAVCPGWKIRIAMAGWTNARQAIVDALGQLSKPSDPAKLCSVEVLTGDNNAPVKSLGDKEISVFGLPEGGCRYPTVEACYYGDVHSKYALVDTGTQKIVYTGSHNYTSPGLDYNDETLMKITDEGVYNAFLADYTRQREEAVEIEPNRYPNATVQTVNTEAGGDQDDPEVAMNSAGDSAVVWEDTPGTSNTNAKVMLRRYRAGVAQPGQLNVSGTGTGAWAHIDPDVGLDSAGNAVVVWADDGNGDGSRDIKVVRLGPTGNVLGSTTAHATLTGDQIAPAVAVEPDGDFVVGWESGSAVYASRFAANLTRQWERRVSAASGTTNKAPDVGVDQQGNSVFVWDEDSDGNGVFNVGLSGLDAAGNVTISERNANASNDKQQTQGSIAVNRAGLFTVAWKDDRSGSNRIWTRGFDARGEERFAEKVLMPNPTKTWNPDTCADCPAAIGQQTVPSVAIDDNANAIIVCDETETVMASGQDVWARGVSATGAFTAFPVHRMNPDVPNLQAFAAVGGSPSGDFVVAYADDRGNDGYAQLRLRTGFHH